MARTDSMGIFWQDVKTEKGGPVREMPKIPKTGWKAPKDFPNLKGCKKLAIDTETYDPELLDNGPGWARGPGKGHIVGISVAADEKNAWYFPMRHEVMPEDNMDPEKVLLWAKDNLTHEGLKIGANLIYDLGWLREEGIIVPGPYLDVQHAEALIDENKLTYTLESISQKYLKQGKISNKLYKWCARFYGGKINDTQRKNMYRTPPRLAGPYAEGDAWQPFKIWKKQKKIIQQQNLEVVLDLECRLIPMLLDMRFRGVRIDLDYVEKLQVDLLEEEKILQSRLDYKAGRAIDIYSSNSIAKAFDLQGLNYPKTAKGNPSFVKTWLNNHPSEIAQMIVKTREVQKMRSTFIENFLLEKNINGRVFCTFRQLKSDDGGTISGRLSSSNPNLQQIPARDPILGPKCRRCFIPDEGYPNWWRGDTNQVEYRTLAHYAVGPGAKEMRKKYKNDPRTDYHVATTEQIYDITGMKLDRKPTKTINFGLVYGMMEPKLKATLGIDDKTGDRLFSAYHEGAPFVSATFNHADREAQETGMVKTILGRRARFEVYKAKYSRDKYVDGRNNAIREFGHNNYERAFTYRALNRKLQGSAADHMKKAMVDTYESGVYDRLGGVPALTVHDELDGSCDYQNPRHVEALKEVKHIMENCVKMKVPLIVDFEIGDDWSNTEVV